MNNIGHQAPTVLSGPAPRTVICPTAEYRAPGYICYDYICQHCPREDLGHQLIFLPQASADPHHYGPPPRLYTRFYHDHRFQVYAVNRYDMPPQLSRARVCSFWCHHDINLSPSIQRAWYYGQFSNHIPRVLRANGNQALTDPISGHSFLFGPPVGFRVNSEADDPANGRSEDAISVQSLQSEESLATPSPGNSSEVSRSSVSSGLPLTPRTIYNQAYSPAATYRLPTIPYAEVTMDETELEHLRHSGAIFVAEMMDNDRTPTRHTFGDGGVGAATPTPRRTTVRLGGANGLVNMNPPPGPEGRGAGRGQGRGRGGRPTRIWNWHN